jgi:hypothetical protein
MPAIDPIADDESGLDARTKINAAIAQVNGLGDAATKNVGTAAGTVAAGDDTRFTNARTPTTHAASHKHGGNDEVATSTPAANAIPKAGEDNKLAAGWLPIGNTANTICEGNDARLSDSRTPTSHADSHVTEGADKIRDATASQDGLMTSAHATKLDGIDANADVTEDAIDDATAVTTLADTDKIPLVSAGALKNIAYSALKTLLNALYAAKGAVTSSGLTMNTGKLLGRRTASIGAIEEIDLPLRLLVPFSDQTTNFTTGTKFTFTWRFGAASLSSTPIDLSDAPTGSAAQFDVKKNGTSIYSTKPTIDAGETSTATAATPAVLSTTSIADGDVITIIIDQTGSTNPGKGGILTFLGTTPP